MEFIVAVLLFYSDSKYFTFIFSISFSNFFSICFFLFFLFFFLTYVPLLRILGPRNPPLLPPIVRGGLFCAP